MCREKFCFLYACRQGTLCLGGGGGDKLQLWVDTCESAISLYWEFVAFSILVMFSQKVFLFGVKPRQFRLEINRGYSQWNCRGKCKVDAELRTAKQGEWTFCKI